MRVMNFFGRSALLAFSLTASVFAADPAPLTAPPLSGSLGQPIELFNGQDFSGWVWFQRPPRPGTDTPVVERDAVFSIQEGVLRSKGRPTGYLRTERAFTNFILTVEQRHIKAGNGGLLVAIPEKDKVWPGLEIQTRTGNAGELWNHNSLKLTANPAYIDPKNPKHIFRATDDSQKPVGEWETMEVIVDAGNLVFKVNGVVQSVVTNTESLAGRVGIQTEGAEMEFRKIQLTPIESAK
jgi:hypothetical protein